jgi:hypothetical protein
MLISLLPVPECILVIGVANSSQDFPVGWPKNLSLKEKYPSKKALETIFLK